MTFRFVARVLTAMTLLAATLVSASQAEIKIACLGDSITAGQGPGISKEQALTASFPAALRRMLDSIAPGEYDVRGFGAGGHSLRPDVPRPYLGSPALASGTAFAPDLAIVVLGTNDSVHGGADSDWRSHVAALQSQLRTKSPGVRILLASPPPMRPGTKGLKEARRADLKTRRPRLFAIGQALRESAEQLDGVEFVDLAGTLRDRDVVDGVHPNPLGAQRIARRLAEAVMMETESNDAHIPQRLDELFPGSQPVRVQGRPGIRLKLNTTPSQNCIVLRPDRVARGMPWLARQLSPADDMRLAHRLLDRGIHVFVPEHSLTLTEDLPSELIKVMGVFGKTRVFETFPDESKQTLLYRPSKNGPPFSAARSVFAEPVTDLDPLAPLLRALLRSFHAPAITASPATVPVPAAEYRGKNAGWGEGAWSDAYAYLKEAAEAEKESAPVDVLLIGDSITQGLTAHGNRFGTPEGRRPFDQLLGPYRAFAAGLSGDRTEHILHRIHDGSFDALRPRTILLQIGINNLNAEGHTGGETFEGIAAVASALRARFPKTAILICGPFPAGKTQGSRLRTEVHRLHERLAAHTWEGATEYVDLRELFVDGSGVLRDTMAHDALHISKAGQTAWLEAVLPWLREQLKE